MRGSLLTGKSEMNQVKHVGSSFIALIQPLLCLKMKFLRAFLVLIGMKKILINILVISDSVFVALMNSPRKQTRDEIVRETR